MIQTKTEMQKLIRKEKPEAKFIVARRGALTYRASLGEGDKEVFIFFKVPFDDIADGIFNPTMPSQLLIRYLID